MYSRQVTDAYTRRRRFLIYGALSGVLRFMSSDPMT